MKQDDLPLAWKKGELVVKAIAALLIPIALAVGSHLISLSIKSNEHSLKQLEISTSILNDRDSDQQLRRWACDFFTQLSAPKSEDEIEKYVQFSQIEAGLRNLSLEIAIFERRNISYRSHDRLIK